MPKTETGWRLDPPTEEPIYRDPMTAEERKSLREAGASEAAIRKLEADRLELSPPPDEASASR